MSCLESCGEGRFDVDLVGERDEKQLCMLHDMAYEHSEDIV